MLFRVLGVEERSGEFKGNQFSGRNLYCAYPDSYQSDRLQGIKMEKVYVPDKLRVGPIHPDDNVDVSYNKYGRVENVAIV